MPERFGFTLIELLVVISIMAIVAITVIVSFGSFEEDANLKNETFNIQSYLRLAQSNATAGVKCTDASGAEQGGVGWSVSFTSKDAIQLGCEAKESSERTWSINPPTYIYLIQGSSGSTTCSSSFNPDIDNNNIIINFATLSGRVEFKDSDEGNNCLEGASNMIITVRKKVESGDFKTVTINRGGSINVE